MRLETALKLGRVSNLPTVWTNCLVGFAVAKETPELFTIIIIWFAFSFFYTAGMFLNDVFDYRWDALHKQDRPIVMGEARRGEVIWFSIVLIVAGFVCTFAASAEGQVYSSMLSVLTLVGCILLYDWKHKVWAISPWIMGGCRLMVYCSVALTVAPFSFEFVIPGLCLMGYIAGITYLASAEHLNRITAWWPIWLLGLPLGYAVYLSKGSFIMLSFALVLTIWLGASVRTLFPGPNRSIPKSVANLLAGICLIDALILVGLVQYKMAAAGVLAFFLTLYLQKKIKAT